MSLRPSRIDRDGQFSGQRPSRAVIDIGSNTVRLVLYGGSPRAPSILLNEKVTPRLGRDLACTGELPDEARALALRGLARYALLLRGLGIAEDAVDVVATAATREAGNGPAFLEEIAALGFHPRVLSGAQEGCMSGWGVAGAFPEAHGLVADLGGGSLEVVRVEGGAPTDAVSLPIGTLRMPAMGGGDHAALKTALAKALKAPGPTMPDDGDLYLVGGTWRAMAVYAMDRWKHPLSDPHGLSLPMADAMRLARHLAGAAPGKLHRAPRVSTMRSETLPDAGVLLQVLLKRFRPRRVIVSAWGLREGMLYRALPPHMQAQDPLIAGIATFAAQRGAPPTLTTRTAGWTADIAPARRSGLERVRYAAIALSLAAMQIEPNLRLHQGIDWALHKRWLGIGPEGRAMLAAAIHGNGNCTDLPKNVRKLAEPAALEQALCWGLAVRLARRLGARSTVSLEASRLEVVEDRLRLRLEADYGALVGPSTHKDMGVLAQRLDLTPEVEILPEGVGLNGRD